MVAAALAQYNRSQVLKTTNGNEVVLYAYNANPNSMAAALGSFAQRPCMPGQTKLVVLGDVLELGDYSSAEHRQVGKLPVQGLQLLAMLIGPAMAAAAAVARYARHFATKAEAAEWLRQHPVLNRQVLVKGSRSMTLETLVELL